MRASRTLIVKILLLLATGALICPMSACSSLDSSNEPQADAQDEKRFEAISDRLSEEDPKSIAEANEEAEQKQNSPSADELRESLGITEDYRASFDHGEKGPAYQKYIVLHDTESDAPPSNIVNYWDNSGNFVAAHFVVGKDGGIVQCVPLDRIAHHAGFGDTGHNTLYGTEDESRDDKRGSSSIGSWAADYGMNSYSVGIELVHVGGKGGYPTEQLQALDGLIAYIDAYYGFESKIIDHKAWRSGNSDTSPEFTVYLSNYQNTRTHDGS